MSPYRAILFDLFGTVALLDRQKLPVFEWGGQTIHSTMAALRTLYEQRAPGLPFTDFFAALTDVTREVGEQRAQGMREISSVQEFALILKRASLADSLQTRRLAEELSLAHTASLAGATEIPPRNAIFLGKACARYHVALVTNFDHGPTVRQVLDIGGVTEYFDRIVISDEHGWRKPHPRIFTDTLAALRVKPEEALFVGDSPRDDIAGAKNVGMDVAWINAQGSALPGDVPTPDYTVRAIPELQPFLF